MSGSALPRHIRYAVRSLRKSPGFVLVVVVTLGLGLGANTTVFGIIRSLLLNPLPVHDPSALVAVASVGSGRTGSTNTFVPISYANFRDYQRDNGVFTALAGYTRLRLLTLHTQGPPQPLLAELVTDNYFSTLGVGMAVGRTS
jgi:putative ABC transport system permease protein